MTMKRWTTATIAAAVSLCMPSVAVAQKETTGRGPSLTGHWAFRWTRLYEDGARLAGGGIGVILGDGSRLEFVGFGTASPSIYGSLEFHVAYGGIRVEREVWRSGRFATSAALFGGAGSFWTKERRTDEEERAGIGVVEPTLLVGVDLGAQCGLPSPAAIGGLRAWRATS